MRRIAYCACALALLTLTLSAAAAEPASDAAEPTLAPPLFATPATPDCQDISADAQEMTDPPPGTECCGGGLIPGGCSGACYVEIYCPDGSFVGCYGSNPDACRVEGSYVVCDANYYSCNQCGSAIGCEFC